MYEVVGIERKRGSFEGREYDNFLFYTVYPKKGLDSDGNVIGKGVMTIKIKACNLGFVVEIGDIISPLYDRFGNCVCLTLNNSN